MSSFISDIECMVLERVKFNRLKHVSKVRRQWRKYISEHMGRMSSFPCDRITIESTVPRISVYKKLGNLITISYWKHGTVPKVLSSVDTLVKYRATTFEFMELSLHTHRDFDSNGMSTQPTDKRYQLYAQVISLPRWWFGSITEVRLTLRENFPPANFAACFPAVKFLYIHVADQKTVDLYLNNFIMGIPRINKLTIERFEQVKGPEIILNDSVLETIMKKSWIDPIAFPHFTGKQNFSLKQIIRFIELAKICPAQDPEEYLWVLVSPVKGKREDWKDWIMRNATVFPLGPGRQNPAWEIFTFRGILYKVVIPYFVD